jgi:hypothetical protein
MNVFNLKMNKWLHNARNPELRISNPGIRLGLNNIKTSIAKTFKIVAFVSPLHSFTKRSNMCYMVFAMPGIQA